MTAVLTLCLAIGYLVAGSFMVGRWQIEPTESVLLLGRRIGAYFLGLSIMFFLARSIPASPARRAICSSAVVSCLLLAMLGVYEHSTGRAATPILASAAVEVFIAVAFGWHLIADRRRGSADGRNT